MKNNKINIFFILFLIIILIIKIIFSFYYKELFIVSTDINNESTFTDLTTNYLKTGNSLLIDLNKKNINIDSNIENLLLSKLVDNILLNNLSEISSLPVINTTDSNIIYIDNNEVNQIISVFINYINNKLIEYSFSLLKIGNVELNNITSSNESISKQYMIPLFIYEKNIGYVKSMKLICTITKYTNKKGHIIINNISFIKKIDTNDIQLLPSINKYIFNYHTANTGNNYPDLLLTQKDIDLEAARQVKIKQLREDYTCFNIPDSQNINNNSDCLMFGGVWDKPVNDNTECSFYLANKNYDNTRGGVKNDYCEFPSGLKVLSYRSVSAEPDSIPLCYNCKTNLIGQGTLGHCCNTQTHLKSPDYKFPGDELDRYNSKDILYSAGLNYS